MSLNKDSKLIYNYYINTKERKVYRSIDGKTSFESLPFDSKNPAPIIVSANDSRITIVTYKYGDSDYADTIKDFGKSPMSIMVAMSYLNSSTKEQMHQIATPWDEDVITNDHKKGKIFCAHKVRWNKQIYGFAFQGLQGITAPAYNALFHTKYHWGNKEISFPFAKAQGINFSKLKFYNCNTKQFLTNDKDKTYLKTNIRSSFSIAQYQWKINAGFPSGENGFYLGIGAVQNGHIVTNQYILIALNRTNGTTTDYVFSYLGSAPSIKGLKSCVNGQCQLGILLKATPQRTKDELAEEFYNYANDANNHYSTTDHINYNALVGDFKLGGVYYTCLKEIKNLTADSLNDIVTEYPSYSDSSFEGLMGTVSVGSSLAAQTVVKKAYINDFSNYDFHWVGNSSDTNVECQQNDLSLQFYGNGTNLDSVFGKNGESEGSNKTQEISETTFSKDFFYVQSTASKDGTALMKFIDDWLQLSDTDGIKADVFSRTTTLKMKIDKSQVQLDYYGWAIKKDKYNDFSDSVFNPVTDLNAIFKSSEGVTFSTYYSSENRTDYRLVFFKRDNDAWNYSENYNLNNILNEISEKGFLYDGNEISANVYCSCEPNYYYLKSFELFEAYTRGRDFLEHDYITLRPQEVDTDGNKKVSYDDNYFYHKYSGRDFFLPRSNKDIDIGVVYSKDLIQETDVTLGDTYAYERYFIEKVHDKTEVTPDKDTFMLKDLTEAMDDTCHIEDDLEVITSNIDLTQCEYYRPYRATYENHWCDCEFYGENTGECLYQKSGFCPYRFLPERHPRRIRTLAIEKSNRFNIIQEASKVFEMYPVFYTNYENTGKVKLNEQGELDKNVFFITEKGKVNQLGFRYEKNLASMSRSIDSSSITTKLYVENVDSELNDEGVCSIALAEDNISRNSWILNFDYYVKMGNLDKEQLERDLYGKDKTDLAYLPTIGYYNKKYDDLSNLIINMTGEGMTELQAKNDVNITGVTTALEQRQKISQNMYQFKIRNQNRNTSVEYDYTTSDSYKNYLIKYKEQATILWGLIEQLFISDGLACFWKDVKKDPILIKLTDSANLVANIEWFSKEEYDSLISHYCQGELYWRLLIEGFPDDTQLPFLEKLTLYNPPFESWVDFKENIVDKNLYLTCGMMGQYKGMYEQVRYWRMTQAKYLKKINSLNEEFYKKYEPYIKEGTWTDSNYLTHNEYYWAAQHVLDDSSKPSVSYSYKVVDISLLQGYEDYECELADTTYVEDIDFFGINKKTGLLNREKVTLTAIDYNLDSPKEDSITTQNYSSSFEDLFEQISASVQSLTFNENTYKRASNFTSTHAVSQESLQAALDGDDFTFVNNYEDNLVIDENGTQGSNINNTSNKYKLTGEGLFFSNDGGTTWNLGVGPQGLNMDYAKFGSIDTSKIQLVDNSYIYFLWDKSGISAYRNPASSTNGLTDFARFNKYGLSLVEKNKIRLRAGYEFKATTQDIDGYNLTGDYTQEQDLSNQNVGFYLYNDNGVPIFKTETRSAYAEDSNADYSARLSMTGEMFVTNDVLPGENDGSHAFTEKVFKLSDAYAMIDTSYNDTEELQNEDNDEETKILLNFDRETDKLTNGATEGYRSFEITLDDNKKYTYYYKDNQDNNEDTINFTRYYHTDVTYEKLKINDNIVDASNYNIYNIYSVIIEIEQGDECPPEDNGECSEDLKKKIQEQEEEFSPTLLTVNPLVKKKAATNSDDGTAAASDTTDDTTIYQITGGKTTVHKLDKHNDSLSIEAGQNSIMTIDNQDLTYEDGSTLKTISKPYYFYQYTDSTDNKIYNYWAKAEETDKYTSSATSVIKTESVGIFINNKLVNNMDELNSLFVQETDPDDDSYLNTVAGEGADRLFTICIKGKDTDTQKEVYQNVFSTLKNGCAYFGGEICSETGATLKISNLGYLPDKISIKNPTMILLNNGNWAANWDKFYPILEDQGGIGNNSLQTVLQGLDSGIMSGGGGISTAGVYILDPIKDK